MRYSFPAVHEGAYLTEMAASLFGYAGEQGDHNSLYTYAQLLRTGTVPSYNNYNYVTEMNIILLGSALSEFYCEILDVVIPK